MLFGVRYYTKSASNAPSPRIGRPRLLRRTRRGPQNHILQQPLRIGRLVPVLPARTALRERDHVDRLARPDGVAHDVHAWALSSDVHALSAHVVMNGHPTLEEAQVVGDRLKRLIAERFGIAHATLELECEPCMDDDRDPCAMDALTPTLEHRHAH